MIFYFDMDGVLVDQNGSIKGLEGLEGIERDRLLMDNHKSFAEFKPSIYLDEMVDIMKNMIASGHTVSILTSLGSWNKDLPEVSSLVLSGKMNWVSEYIPDFVDVKTVHNCYDKRLFSEIDSILIDDSLGNCYSFTGTGVDGSAYQYSFDEHEEFLDYIKQFI